MPGNPGTANNNERSDGYRKVPAVSGYARPVTGVRHLDLDLYQYCPDCGEPQIFVESKTIKEQTYAANWGQTRRFAEAFGVPAMLVIEKFSGESLGVKLARAPEYLIQDKGWRTQPELQKFFEHARDLHAAKGCNENWFRSRG
jgi:hypothetical protein